MKNVDAEAMIREAFRDDVRRFLAELARNYGAALALGSLCLLLGGVASWAIFQITVAGSIGGADGAWYLTSGYVAFILGAIALAAAWAVVKTLRFIGRRPAGAGDDAE